MDCEAEKTPISIANAHLGDLTNPASGFRPWILVAVVIQPSLSAGALLAYPITAIQIFHYGMVMLALQNLFLSTSCSAARSRAKFGGT